MISILVLFCTSLVVVSGAPQKPQRIVGGSLTTISEYPYAASLLYGYVSYSQACGGTILNIRTVLTAAHCVYHDDASQWRVRLGSSLANRGGVVYTLASIVIHSSFDTAAGTLDNDVSLLRTSTAITYISGYIQPATVAGTNYNLADNETVYAIGWGATAINGAGSDQLRHVEVSVVDQAICRSRYAELGWTITDNMLCSGWLDEGGRDQCHGDSGGPLIHNSVIVGICSWRSDCAQARYPGVNTRVSRFANWIVVNS